MYLGIFFFLIPSVEDPGSAAFLTPGSGMGKKLGSGYGMNSTDQISESLETIYWDKMLKFFDAAGSRMEKIWIRDPQHCLYLNTTPSLCPIKIRNTYSSVDAFLGKFYFCKTFIT
jgi:hypothetical protein